MAAEDNLIIFNSHKKYSNQINERKKHQIIIQDVMEFGLKMSTSPELSTSSN
jgi:hypothetical protein